MTREEAIRVLTELADEYERYELSKNGWLGTTYIPAHRMGAAALRDVRSRSEGCPACHGDGGYLHGSKGSVYTRLSVSEYGGYIEASVPEYGGNREFYFFDVAYCPMCGRKLEDEK